jgi:hypothetical protein
MIDTLITINGVEPVGLSGWAVQRNKLWFDAGRNLAGGLRTTLVGTFAEIELDFTYMDKDDLSDLVEIFDDPIIDVQWYDVRSKSLKSGQYYAADFTNPVFDPRRELFAPFSVRLIPLSKIFDISA